MKQYQLAMPQQVFSGETGMQALESLAARHKKAAVFTDAGIRASGILERPLAELDKAGMSDQWIMKHIGMNRDELLRLKQISGLADLFADKDFSIPEQDSIDSAYMPLEDEL